MRRAISWRSCQLLVVVVLAAYQLLAVVSWVAPDVAPSDKRFVYEGRWAVEQAVAEADWPNTAIHFQVRGSGVVKALLDGGSVVGGTKLGVACAPLGGGGGSSYKEVRVGTSLFGGYSELIVAELPSSSAATYVVSITKLTEASFFPQLPMGVEQSTLKFGGLRLPASVSLLEAPARSSRRIEVVGDSDITAWGTEDFLNASGFSCVKNWVANQNCGASWAADLARSLGSELQVVATMGKGVYLNADTYSIPSGPPMPDVYNRTLAVAAAPAWDFRRWVPDLVLIRLGNNDYSRKDPPPVPVFIEAYLAFIHQIFTAYRGGGRNVTVVSVCGGGYTTDRGRNYACPTVRQAATTWSRRFASEGRVEYVEIPAGVASDADRGCMDHPREAAHAKIAQYLEPHIRRIMSWTDAGRLYV